MNYVYREIQGIFFAIASEATISDSKLTLRISPSECVEFLTQFPLLIKQVMGTSITEESLRRNFILISEMLDEMLEYGFPQVTNLNYLIPLLHNEPIVTQSFPSQPTAGPEQSNSIDKIVVHNNPFSHETYSPSPLLQSNVEKAIEEIKEITEKKVLTPTVTSTLASPLLQLNINRLFLDVFEDHKVILNFDVKQKILLIWFS